MSEISLLPSTGAVFFDPRHEGRSLRLSWHEPDQVYVVSFWRDDVCVATFQLPRDEVPRLMHALALGLAVPGVPQPGATGQNCA